jgi:hypothetical protein
MWDDLNSDESYTVQVVHKCGMTRPGFILTWAPHFGTDGTNR